MKTFLASLAVAGLALSTGAAFAQDVGTLPAGQDFASVDTDRNGGVSWAEFSLIFTDITEEQFNTADADGNGELSPEEFDTLNISTGSISSGMSDDAAPADSAKSLTDTTT